MTESDNNFAPTFFDHYLLPDTYFNGHCLINNNISIPKIVINLLISYTLSPWLRNSVNDFTWNNCFFGSVKLTKNADADKYKYSGCSIRFDFPREFPFIDGSIFGADMNSFVPVDKRKKDILIPSEDPKQGLDDITLTVEEKYRNNFTQLRKRFVLNIHCVGRNSFLLANATKVYQFKLRNFVKKDYTLCLRNISKDFTINNMKKVGLKRIVNFFLFILILLILMIF